ncbi:MAG TPA: HAMP domain-containing sensor histidine kinase, partial [Candidatus Limnocylindrales bacterium]
MSLSRRLLVLVVGLVAVALVAADVAGYAALRSLLLSRAHDDLVSATAPLTKLLSSPSGDPKTGGSDLASIHLVDASYQIFDASGTLVRQAPVVRYGKEDLAVPATPSLDRLPINQWPADSTPVKSLVVPSTDGSLEYDIAAYQASDGSTVVIGIPLIDADNTLTLLAQIEAVVSVVVVAVAALASTWLVRLGLRPLARMETTAGEIAGGDLSRRVEPADSRTEVGRLGTALNSMLRRIESAFAAERDSEDRLRRLVADASHELRTPLTAIRGYAELFRRGADRRPEDLARAMRGIESEAERMGRLIDDLLLLARLDE